MLSVRTTLFLPEKYHKFLKALSKTTDTSMAKLIQNAVDAVYFKPHKKTAKDLWGIAKNSRLTENDFINLKKSYIPKI